MNIQEATADYESWLGSQMPLVAADLEFKHEQMRAGAFPFFRATFYLWMRRFEKLDESIVSAPEPLAVGDLHVENFGTWIDAEGRLVWGVNDFDEAMPLPYTNDLIRLASSIDLAIRVGDLKVSHVEACEAIERGYDANLADEGAPFVLAENNVWLRNAATGELRDPVVFWRKMDALPKGPASPDSGAIAALVHGLPEPNLPYDLRSRRAGLGSLGRPRYVALANWRGGRVAREAKAMAASAALWSRGTKASLELVGPSVIQRSVRCADPCLTFEGAWQVRRLAPYSSRIELSVLSRERDETRLIEAMGWETANIHRGSPELVGPIRKHLHDQPKKWLKKASSEMTERVVQDFEQYREG